LLKENQKFSFAYQVKPSDLAQNLAISDEDDHPPVLATAKMILLMEVACARMMQPLVRDRELSAGVDVSIRHLAATLCDEEVTIEALSI
jgi:fluoroacetyl-CoA thioesterase